MGDNDNDNNFFEDDTNTDKSNDNGNDKGNDNKSNMDTQKKKQIRPDDTGGKQSATTIMV